MTDMTDFLLARIAEDEEVARAALHQYGPWRYNPSKHNVSPTTGIAEESVFAGAAGPAAITVASTGPSDDPQSMADADHIARWDPSRVLAECDAKRRIMERQRATHEAANRKDSVVLHSSAYGLLWAMQALALPYAEHPDYREEWKP